MDRARKSGRFAASALLGVVLLGWPGTSQAYRMDDGAKFQVRCDNPSGFAHWNKRNIAWYHNDTVGQGAGKRSVLEAALATWSKANVPDTSYDLTYAGTTTQGVSSTDNQNTFVWGDGSLCGSKACHAVTILTFARRSKEIIDADIVFNNSMTWTTDNSVSATTSCASAEAGKRLDTRAIATHELGHSLGIHHTEGPTTLEPFLSATMGGKSCNVAGQTLTADDMEALKCSEDRYPMNPSYEGFHELANCRDISGWGWNANRPNRPIYVEIHDGSGPLAVVPADIYRDDLLNAGKGNGRHVFSYAPDLRDGQWHSIYTRFSGTGGNLTWTPRDIACDVGLFTGMVPDQVLDTGGIYTVGTQFSSSQTGSITELRYFMPYGETGSHVIRLWNDSGGTPIGFVNVDATCNNATSSPKGRWCGGPVTPYGQGSPSPILIQANTLYRVGVDTETKQSKSPCSVSSPTSLSSPILQWPLTAHQGLWSAGDTFPNTGSCSNFFVDVRFDT